MNDHSKVCAQFVRIKTYLFVPLITALNDSGCQFLLLTKRATLQGGGEGAR